MQSFSHPHLNRTDVFSERPPSALSPLLFLACSCGNSVIFWATDWRSRNTWLLNPKHIGSRLMNTWLLSQLFFLASPRQKPLLLFSVFPTYPWCDLMCWHFDISQFDWKKDAIGNVLWKVDTTTLPRSVFSVVMAGNICYLWNVHNVKLFKIEWQDVMLTVMLNCDNRVN